MLEKSYYEKADEIIAHYGPKPSTLIPIMQDVQEDFSSMYMPPLFAMHMNINALYSWYHFISF